MSLDQLLELEKYFLRSEENQTYLQYLRQGNVDVIFKVNVDDYFNWKYFSEYSDRN